MVERQIDTSILRVGSKVRLKFGGRQVTGTIIEDRGRSGYAGRQIFRLRLDMA
jgi:hypothetical protein